MKKLLAFILLALPILAAAEPPRFKFGVISPLTGSAASSGVTVKNSVQLAQEKFDPQHSVQFIFEDDQLSPKNTVSAVNKLIMSDKVQGLLVFGSPTSLAVNSISEAHQLPMIALSIVDRVVSGLSYVVKLWVPARVENELVVREIKRRGYKRVAVAATINDAMLSLKQLVIESLPGQVLISEDVNREDSDLRTIALRVLSKSPDAVYNLLWAPQPSLFAKALREKGFKGPVFGVHNLEDPNEIANSGGALDGAWLVTGDDSAASEYIAEYAARFGSPPAAGGANAYDAAKLLIEGSRTENLNNFLHSVRDFRGAYGVYSSSGKNDFTIGARLKYIQSGALTGKLTEQGDAPQTHG